MQKLALTLALILCLISAALCKIHLVMDQPMDYTLPLFGGDTFVIEAPANMRTWLKVTSYDGKIAKFKVWKNIELINFFSVSPSSNHTFSALLIPDPLDTAVSTTFELNFADTISIYGSSYTFLATTDDLKSYDKPSSADKLQYDGPQRFELITSLQSVSLSILVPAGYKATTVFTTQADTTTCEYDYYEEGRKAETHKFSDRIGNDETQSFEMIPDSNLVDTTFVVGLSTPDLFGACRPILTTTLSVWTASNSIMDQVGTAPNAGAIVGGIFGVLLCLGCSGAIVGGILLFYVFGRRKPQRPVAFSGTALPTVVINNNNNNNNNMSHMSHV